jgi:uncharacterized membrane protein (DUF4010 family)
LLALAANTASYLLLLSLKVETERFVRLITREDIYATLKFAVITAIVLPVLPSQSFGPPPFDVVNPYQIWLMVIFVSGISFLPRLCRGTSLGRVWMHSVLGYFSWRQEVR